MQIVGTDGEQILEPGLLPEASKIASRVLESMRRKAAKSGGAVADVGWNKLSKGKARCIVSRVCGIPNTAENKAPDVESAVCGYSRK